MFLNSFLNFKENFNALLDFKKSTTSINLFEKDDSLILKTELPGLKKEDVNLQLRNDVLTISYERKNDVKENESYHRREREFGQFSKQIRLPYKVDEEKVSASLENGILTVTMEKSPDEKPRTITVK